ncbi:hypothetical protein JYP46_19320 [Nitratireductor aquimarinus]|uniref:hypothetical protein n=1 Tax=Alphaproteobacteria TaxID=28211 RepID=UPI0019D3557A|nr:MULTISPECIES: hypothetical protein [Alphaproteobacteria]MBN7758983.1 hypothetical protein [Nitratireductor aquimarinus]MBY6001656.1 hypothetical protein [Tritonibacter mobilis]MBY6023944.1 hypothetical protein [Nitratireductor sp. DP7N14-4]
MRPFEQRAQTIIRRLPSHALAAEIGVLRGQVIEAWFPKVKSGGWIGGHDYQNPDARFCFGVDRAVDEWIEETGRTLETDLNFTWWARV